MHSLEMIKYMNSPKGLEERKKKDEAKARKARPVPPVTDNNYYSPQPAFALLKSKTEK